MKRNKFFTVLMAAVMMMAMSITSFAASKMDSFDFNEEIEFIRETYNYTNEHIGEYTKQAGINWEGNFPINEDCDVYVDASGTPVLAVSTPTSDDELTQETYYLNPALGRASDVPYLDYMAVFIYAKDSAGNEYRMYLREGMILRTIGPDGSVKDFPDGISLINYGYADNVPGWSMLVKAAPGWWIDYEGEDD